MQEILFSYGTAESFAQKNDQYHCMLPKGECEIVIVKKTMREELCKIGTSSDIY